MTLQNRIKIVSFYLCLFLIALTSFNVLLISIKENPVALQSKENSSMAPIFSQSWAFFTRNPREGKIRIYQIKGNKLTLLNYKNTLPSNLFGIVKKNRITTHLINTKFDEIPEKFLFQYKGEPSYKLVHKLLQENKIRTLKLSSLKYLAKGKYLIVKTEPVPWAWYSKIEKQIFMTSSLIVFTVKHD